MKKKCDCCNKKRDMVDVFIFRDRHVGIVRQTAKSSVFPV